ncbi:hypothetical protein KP509_06G003100 [Ceratopteris richardii]|nr:hypothetical protein KP509_06G003100 [Ceratopteris richardii]
MELIQTERERTQFGGANAADRDAIFLALLRGCANIKDLRRGIRIHENILRQGLLEKCSDALICMYARCGALEEATDLFEVHKSRDIFTCTALIAAYVQAGQAQHALDIFDYMQRECLPPNEVTCVCLLKACGSLQEAVKGQEIHDEVLRRGLLRNNVKLGNALIAMHAKCGAFAKAEQVLSQLQVPNVISWTTLISAYADHGKGEEALMCYEQMRYNNVAANTVTFTCLLKACGSIKALDKGEKFHDEIAKEGLFLDNVVLGTALVDMYAKCGALVKACHVLEDMPVHNVITWNALISGYVEHNEGEQAIRCLEQMKGDGLSPDAVTFACILKACASICALDIGVRIHNEVANQGLLYDSIIVGNALVDMYAKCGALSKARETLLELPERNSISWNSLISGYTEHGEGAKALDCFEQMQQEGITPVAVTFACALKACGSIGAVYKGEDIHNEIIRQGLLKDDVVLGAALIDMYAKCGVIAKARQVLEVLPVGDVVCWTSLIGGYAEFGQDEEALVCFELMESEGISPSPLTFSCALRACGNLGAADTGEKIHNAITKQGLLANNVLLGNALVDMYAKCGNLAKARQVLEKLSVRSTVCWNALILGYTEHREFDQALNCFDQMLSEGLFPDEATYMCILRVCGSIGAAEKGEQICEEIQKHGLLQKDIMLATALVDMYTKLHLLGKAQQTVEELPFRDVFIWTTLIAGHTDHGEAKLAFECFEKMQSEGISPDGVTFACILKACGSIRAVDQGQIIHYELAKQGLLGTDITLGNALVDMYAKCSDFKKAWQVLEELATRDVQTWNSLIAGLAVQEKAEDVFICLEQMQDDGILPNAETYLYVLRMCGNTGALTKGAKYHAEIIERKLMDNNVLISMGLVDMYAKCGMFSHAKEVLQNYSVYDVPSWNLLIAGYIEHGECMQALTCFEQMESEGICPNAATFALILKVCGNLGAVCKGEIIFRKIAEQGLLQNDAVLGSAVVDMFAKCGALNKAHQVLQELPVQDTNSWNGIMGGMIQRGDCIQVLTCFEQMQSEGLSPNAMTFTYILNACSRLGLIEKAQMYFFSMKSKYGLTPELEHYSCMIDAFGRVGHLDRAVKMTKEMTSAGKEVWPILLGACRKWGDVEVGEWAFEHVL